MIAMASRVCRANPFRISSPTLRRSGRVIVNQHHDGSKSAPCGTLKAVDLGNRQARIFSESIEPSFTRARRATYLRTPEPYDQLRSKTDQLACCEWLSRTDALLRTA